MTKLTPEQIASATPITSTQYCELSDPLWIGQSVMTEGGDFKMYFTNGDESTIYVTENNIF